MFVAVIQILESLTLEKIMAMTGSVCNAEHMKNRLSVGSVINIFLKIMLLSGVLTVINFITLNVPIYRLKNLLSVIHGDATVAYKKTCHFPRYKTKHFL